VYAVHASSESLQRSEVVPPPSAKKRTPLDRQRALQTAVELADTGGIDALSMRNLAAQLGVVPMALYRHVLNKEDLLDGMVETVYSEIAVPTRADWSATMRQRATSMREALRRHPWAVELMETSSPGPANLHYHNAGIACLREQAGLPIRTAIEAYNLMDSYIYGFALQEKTLPNDIAAAADTRRHDLTTADPSFANRFPYLIEIAEELGTSGYDYTAQFERGLELILDGIERLRHEAQGG
jgi:AcrR family transcriptional regulator